MQTDKRIINEAMLQNLPAPARRYLIWTGLPGTPRIKTARVHYSGLFRRGTDQPWMPMTAGQTYTVNPPGFVWDARFKMGGLPLMRARDSYINGEAHMYARLAWVFPIFDLRGEKLLQGTMIRYLQEMMWFPAAFLEPFITWRGVDDSNVEVTFTDHGRSVSGQLTIDAEGKPQNFTAVRYREVNGDFVLNTWCTPIGDYGRMAGLNLPLQGQAVWKLEEGDLAYGDLRIGEVVYGV